jgi:hypothetical protein
MDYRELLKKYIIHVGHQEGISFINPHMRGNFFTDEEVAELLKLEREIDER